MSEPLSSRRPRPAERESRVGNRGPQPPAKKPRKTQHGASGGKLSLKSQAKGWWTTHVQVLLAAAGRLWTNPLGTFLTAAVIGIALALPASLYLLVENANSLASRWESNARFSLYLREDVGAVEAGRLAESLRKRADVAKVQVITAEQALKEYRATAGFGEAVDLLDENPFPSMLVVQPSVLETTAVRELLGQLEKSPQVEQAKLDTEWLERLNAILDLVRRGISIIAGLLVLAVVIVVGNTIRLDIEARRSEIVVVKLVGGTDAFVRRPFLYSGFWYGLLGGLIALILVGATLLMLQQPFNHMIGLFGSNHSLAGMNVESVLTVLIGGGFCGWLGSWLAVSQHLRAIEPT